MIILIHLYLFLFLIKQSTLACQCAKQNNYSPPITLTFTEYGLGQQSTICSYDFNNIHYYCVYDSNGKLIQDNNESYCPKMINGCTKSNSICPDKDLHGTDLTNVISNDDDGSVTCTFGNRICYYDTTGKLLEGQDNNICPSVYAVIAQADTVNTTQSIINQTVTTTTSRNPTTTTISQTLSTTTITTSTTNQTLSTTRITTTSSLITTTTTQNSTTITTSQTRSTTTTRTTTSQTLSTTTSSSTTTQTLSTTLTTRTTTTASTISQTLSTTTTQNPISTTTTQNPISTTTTQNPISTTTTQNPISTTTTRTLSTTTTTQNLITTTTTSPTLSTTTININNQTQSTTTLSIISNYYIQFSMPLNVSDDNITTDVTLVSQLMSIFTTALNTTSNQINITIVTGTSRATKRIVAQIRFFSTVYESADNLLIRTQQQLANSSSQIRQQNLTSQLNKNSIENIKRLYTCSNGVIQESSCTTTTTLKSETSLAVILVASIIPSVVVLILITVAVILIVRYIRGPRFTPRVSRFDRL